MQMDGLRTFLKRTLLIAAVCFVCSNNSGCSYYLIRNLVWSDGFSAFGKFWWTTPPIPISPYWSQLIEDTYHMEERYSKVPILDPVEGEHAPLFCMDAPSEDEVIRSLPDDTGGGFPFVAETQRNNVRMIVEPIVDKIDECRFYPMVGPARLHHCHYKCTVYFTKTIRSSYPIPYTHTDETVDVVYIDHDHLIRCAGPAQPE
jgi:hypothetical protein